MLVAMPSSDPATSSRKWRRLPNMMSRSTRIAHGSPSTSTAALIGQPERVEGAIPVSSRSCELQLRCYSRVMRLHFAITQCGGDTMSQVCVHSFSISLDGFGTGEGYTLDEPFGHAGHRLHEWMFDTRFGRTMFGKTGGSMGVDNAFAERHEYGVGAEIMGRGKFGPPQAGPWTGLGTDEEWRGWWGPNPPFHTPV